MMLNKLAGIFAIFLLCNCSGLKDEDIVLDTPKTLDQVQRERHGKLFGDIEFHFPSSENTPDQKQSKQDNKKEEPKK